jgi:glutamate-1-semialdehyde 2,1-aminomutase
MAANSQSRTLYDRALNVMTAGSTRINLFMEPHPYYARTGRGAYVTDADGEERIDFLNNYFALIHGHAHPAISEAVIRQLREGTCFGMPTEWEILLAEEICARVVSVEEVRFTNSGSEAVMTALKAARAFTGRPKIAKAEGAYHGSYDYAEVSLGSTPETWGEDLPRSVPYSRGVPDHVLDNVVVIPFNDLPRTLRALEPHKDRLAAVLLDLMPSGLGMIPIDPAYLRAVAAFCRENGILLIVDEVISLRLAPGGAQSLHDVRPDLTVMAKIIGGGFPVGAIGGSREAMAVFDPRNGRARLPHGGTFTANPITMVAGLTAMRLLTPEALSSLNALGERLRVELRRCLDEEGVAGQVMGAGSLFRVHLTKAPITDYRSAYPDKARSSRTSALYRSLLRNGIIMSSACSGALSTPMTETEVARCADAFRASLRAAVAAPQPS